MNRRARSQGGSPRRSALPGRRAGRARPRVGRWASDTTGTAGCRPASVVADDREVAAQRRGRGRSRGRPAGAAAGRRPNANPARITQMRASSSRARMAPRDRVTARGSVSMTRSVALPSKWSRWRRAERGELLRLVVVAPDGIEHLVERPDDPARDEVHVIARRSRGSRRTPRGRRRRTASAGPGSRTRTRSTSSR